MSKTRKEKQSEREQALVDVTYAYLRRVQSTEYLIRRKQTVKAQLEASLLPSGIRYDKDPVQVSPEDITGRIVAQISMVEQDITALRRRKAALVAEISRVIELLPDDLEKAVLSDHFIGCRSVPRIAEDLHYSRRSVYHFRRQGVMHLGEILLDTRQIVLPPRKTSTKHSRGSAPQPA